MSPFEFALGALALLLLYRVIIFVCGGGRCRRRERNAETATPSTNEIELMQELHSGLLRMEQRIEALETLLGDQAESRKATAGEKKS